MQQGVVSTTGFEQQGGGELFEISKLLYSGQDVIQQRLEGIGFTKIRGDLYKRGRVRAWVVPQVVSIHTGYIPVRDEKGRIVRSDSAYQRKRSGKYSVHFWITDK